ncbi:hypothetical protein BGZ60DRAFT_466138 [Tricladium varicosporioides]|nr:hypothetical protein BGZ60DRAFT_466138 [Hymenoscyphus varicosporioides]
MKYSATILAASAAIASAQVIYDSSTGTFTCPASNPNGAYCAGDSLVTNIIIRCNNGVGQPGNCNDNLAGQFPQGVNYSPCFETSPSAGDAACSKNCIVYGKNGTSPLPASANCTPKPTTTGAVPTSTSAANSTTPSGPSSTAPSNSTLIVTSSASRSTLSTVTMPTLTGTGVGPLSTGTGSGNGTSSGGSGGSGGSGSGGSGSGSGGSGTNGNGGSATATPIGPTATGNVPFTGGALANSACAALAGVGLVVAYFL